MLQNEDVGFTSSSIKLPLFSPHLLHHHNPNPFLTNLHLILQNFPKFPHPFRQNLNFKAAFSQNLSKFKHPFHQKFNPQNAILQFLRKPINPFSWNLSNTPPLLCCASIALSQSNLDDDTAPSLSPKTESGNDRDGIRLVFQGLEKPTRDERGNPQLLLWWKNRGEQFPSLARVVRDVLAIQASSVASEQVFSAARFQIGDHRYSLAKDSLEISVLFRDWINAERRNHGLPKLSPHSDI